MPTPDVVRQFRGMTQPEPGQKRVFHSFANDPPVPHLAHGIKTKSSLAVSSVMQLRSTQPRFVIVIEFSSSLPPSLTSPQAGDLLNPPPKTRFQQVQLDQQESVYHSKRTAPLGESTLPETIVNHKVVQHVQHDWEVASYQTQNSLLPLAHSSSNSTAKLASDCDQEWGKPCLAVF